MILIGSRALEYYLPLNRKCHDYDLIMSEQEYNEFKQKYTKYWVKTTSYSHIYDIDGIIIEVRNPLTLDPTDNHLLEEPWSLSIKTPIGFAKVPSIQCLYDIKKATAECIDEPKHTYDQLFIERYFPEVNRNTLFYQLRLKETDRRTKVASKVEYDFFHKYHLPEYIKHDRLHEIFADLLNISIPTYKRITVAETDISKELFDKLTHEQKISLMVEESLVLNLERWLIPQMIENGINYRLIDKFYNNNEAMPTYLILKHVCVKGLKGEASFITDFSRNNFFEIEQEWCKAKEVIKSKGGFPNSFFDELFKLRKRYLSGEKIGWV